MFGTGLTEHNFALQLYRVCGTVLAALMILFPVSERDNLKFAVVELLLHFDTSHPKQKHI